MVTYYKVLSDNPVHGKSEKSNVDLQGQEVCLKYQVEELLEKIRSLQVINTSLILVGKDMQKQIDRMSADAKGS